MSDGRLLIRDLARPARLDGDDAAAFRAAAGLLTRVRRAQWGDGDHAEGLREQYARAADTTTEHWRGWIAADGTGEIVGLLAASLPQRENVDVAWLDLVVDPRHRRRGVGSALLAAAERQLRTAGRTVLGGWTETPGAGPWPDALPARSGTGGVPLSAPEAAFAHRHGFALEQVERISRLDVPLEPATLDALEAGIPLAGYELVAWTDRAPAGTAEDYGRLKAAMSTDIPLAELELEAEEWDAARVAEEETELADAGGHRSVCAIRHLGTDRLVGHTVLERFDPRPDVAYQQDTLVLAAHRGHRLGMLLKIHHLRRLATVWPDVRRIYTWNAEENTPVLDLNVELGFRQVGVVGAWQRYLT
ncbi:GNAT family N-acetyltransferase [Tersicoccus sp. MR15.9]|uniref:GNAT family N-acetyltransferase n=1 Tax=Tersicoccus mangrovi TaxID=3121635 RepID=UPI002FE611FA